MREGGQGVGSTLCVSARVGVVDGVGHRVEAGVDHDAVAAGVLDGPQVEDLGTVSGHFQGFFLGEGAQALSRRGRAAVAVAHALGGGARPRELVNVGTAGGLHPGMEGTHEVAAVFQHDFDDPALHAVTGRHDGPPLALSAMIEDGLRRALLDRLGLEARAVEVGLRFASSRSFQADEGARRIEVIAPGETLDVQGLAGVLQRRAPAYDKSREEHYNLISALHKSVRGSDPDAALYWLARMLNGGEDPLYLARRIVRMAVEDIGEADPLSILVAGLATPEATLRERLVLALGRWVLGEAARRSTRRTT